jgi:hypothetical protein
LLDPDEAMEELELAEHFLSFSTSRPLPVSAPAEEAGVVDLLAAEFAKFVFDMIGLVVALES